MPTGEGAARARVVLMAKKLKHCSLSILVSNLFLDIQRPFYHLLGIFIIKNPKIAFFVK